MAYIIYTDGKADTMPPEKANGMWLVLNGEVEGTAQQDAYCATVKKLYLNRRNPTTPQSFLDRYRDVLREMEL